MMQEECKTGMKLLLLADRREKGGELGIGTCGGIVAWPMWETKYNLQLKLRVGGNGTVRKESWKVSVATPLGLRIQKDLGFNSEGIGSHRRF